MSNDRQQEIEDVLLAEALKKAGTFRQVFRRSWPQFKEFHTGGEDLARLKSYEILTELVMRGALTKEAGVFKALR